MEEPNQKHVLDYPLQEPSYDISSARSESRDKNVGNDDHLHLRDGETDNNLLSRGYFSGSSGGGGLAVVVCKKLFTKHSMFKTIFNIKCKHDSSTRREETYQFSEV